MKAYRRKRKKTNVTPEKDDMASANQTPGGYKFAPLVASQQCGERTSTSPLALGYPLLGISRHVRAYGCMPWSSPSFRCSGPFRREMFRPLSAILRHSPSSWAAVVHWSALMPKALSSSRRYLIHSFSCPSHSPRPHQFSEHHVLW